MAELGSISGAGDGTLRVGRVAGENDTAPARQAGEDVRRARDADSVNLSDAARAASRLPQARSPEQAARIAAIRDQIEAGTYESPAKLDAAIDRLITEIQSS
ncbi:MAG: flagellar biosynthesis anti-sigma factor FlgM [Planctomycetota bacterium]